MRKRTDQPFDEFFVVLGSLKLGKDLVLLDEIFFLLRTLPVGRDDLQVKHEEIRVHAGGATWTMSVPTSKAHGDDV